MKQIREVALTFPINDSLHAELLRGLFAFQNKRTPFRIISPPDLFQEPIRCLRDWPGDGAITLLKTRQSIEFAKGLPFPVVNLSGTLPYSGLNRVITDFEMAGRMAAEHMLACGFRRFAYFGLRGIWFSQQRQLGFTSRVKEAGHECSILEVPASSNKERSWRYWVEPLEQWLPTLKPPLGILAVHDYRARLVVDTCLRLGLQVPNEVAVMGIDNDHVACELCQVTLSSVARNNFQVGYEAASLLDRLMSRKGEAKGDILIPPKGVIKRRSTDTVALEDESVMAAVQYIREHISETFGVERLEKVVSVSRRWLEMRFKRCLDCTPHEYIDRQRVEHSKKLLIGVKRLTMQYIAESCGFSDSRHFRAVFQRTTGVTPAKYRRANVGEGKILLKEDTQY